METATRLFPNYFGQDLLYLTLNWPVLTDIIVKVGRQRLNVVVVVHPLTGDDAVICLQPGRGRHWPVDTRVGNIVGVLVPLHLHRIVVENLDFGN